MAHAVNIFYFESFWCQIRNQHPKRHKNGWCSNYIAKKVVITAWPNNSGGWNRSWNPMKCSITFVKIKVINILQIELHKGEIWLLEMLSHNWQAISSEKRGIYQYLLDFKCTHGIKLSMELNDNINNLKDSIREFLSTSHPKCAARSRSTCDAVAAMRPVGRPMLREFA